jgi:hypothetical protein
MALEKEHKREWIAAKRGTLEHELYAAELDLEVAEAGSSKELVKGPKDRVAEVKAQIKVLDDKAKKVEAGKG